MPIPYKIFFEEVDGVTIARFTADTQATYKALFIGRPLPGLPDLEGFVFDFSFQRDGSACLRNGHPGPDPRVQPTIDKLLGRFFELGPYNVLSFVCESLDGKHMAREKMFNDWHAPYANTVTKVAFALPNGRLDKSGEMGEVVGGIFYLKTHPLSETIKTALTAELALYAMIKGA